MKSYKPKILTVMSKLFESNFVAQNYGKSENKARRRKLPHSWDSNVPQIIATL